MIEILFYEGVNKGIHKNIEISKKHAYTWYKHVRAFEQYPFSLFFITNRYECACTPSHTCRYMERDIALERKVSKRSLYKRDDDRPKCPCQSRM